MDVVVCGSLNMDLVARVATLPRPGETVAGRGLQRLPGGKGLNQAVAAARMGAKVAMIGARGDDADGATLEGLLAAEGIDTCGVLRRRPDADSATTAVHTGLAQVMVADDGENAIIVHGGANASLTPDEVRTALAALPHAGVAIAQLETPPATVAAFLGAARARGMRTLLNTAPALPDTRDLLALADIVVLNETELAHYAGAPSPAVGDAYAALARRLLDRADQTIIVTLGAQGALCVTADEESHLAAPRVEVRDTTGAGDCFCGVLAAMSAQGYALAQALPQAVKAASLAVTRVGAAPSMPRAAELV